MATAADIVLRCLVNDGTRNVVNWVDEGAVSDVVGVSGKTETITLSAAFTALSPPTGATWVAMRVVTGAVTLTLKGITTDTGVVLQSAALGTLPLCLPLGTSPSIGILSDGAATIDCLWI